MQTANFTVGYRSAWSFTNTTWAGEELSNMLSSVPKFVQAVNQFQISEIGKPKFQQYQGRIMSWYVKIRWDPSH